MISPAAANINSKSSSVAVWSKTHLKITLSPSHSTDALLKQGVTSPINALTPLRMSDISFSVFKIKRLYLATTRIAANVKVLMKLWHLKNISFNYPQKQNNDSYFEYL